MEDKEKPVLIKQRFAWEKFVAVAALILSLIGLGIEATALNEAGATDTQMMGTSHITDLAVTENLSVGGNATVSGAASFSSISASGTVTGATIVAGSDSFTGAVHYGASSNVISGTLIAHGFTTTPTAISVSSNYTYGLTQTAYILTSNATSFTVGIEAGDVTTLTKLYWVAGK
jgi:hypothetical protein